MNLQASWILTTTEFVFLFNSPQSNVMEKKMILLMAIVAVQSMAYSYPISPRPLRLLIEESELIVWAHVTDIRTTMVKGKYTFDNTVAVLAIQQVLQGKLAATEIEVPYPAGLICPAPPRFEKNSDVLVFLDHDKKRYSVHALSYGVKQLTNEELIIYKARIGEMQQIIKLENTDQKFMSITEWLVKCSEEKATRYEGVYELSRGSDFMSYYDRNEPQPFQHALTNEQRARLKNALLATEELSYTELGLIDLVYASDGERICKFILNKLKAFDESELWYASDFMQRINLYKSSQRTLELAKTFEDDRFDNNMKPNQLRILLNEFVAEAEKLM
jgi:hypothetical protein